MSKPYEDLYSSYFIQGKGVEYADPLILNMGEDVIDTDRLALRFIQSYKELVLATRFGYHDKDN